MRGATSACRPASQDLLDEDTALVGAPLECSAQDPGLQHYYLVLISEELPTAPAAKEAMPFTPAQVSGLNPPFNGFSALWIASIRRDLWSLYLSRVASDLTAAPITYVIDDTARCRDLPLGARKRRRKSHSRHCSWDLCWDGEAMADATAAHTKGSQSLSRCEAPASPARDGMPSAKASRCHADVTRNSGNL